MTPNQIFQSGLLPDFLILIKNSIPFFPFLYHAFCIFDIDNDSEISGPDVIECVDRLCDSNMTRQETLKIFDSIIEECEQDQNGSISFIEFEIALSSLSEFSSSFSIRFA